MYIYIYIYIYIYRLLLRDLTFPYAFEINDEDLVFPYTKEAYLQSEKRLDSVALTGTYIYLYVCIYITYV
jgi:hypothetical protein